jgi:geranylgeranyl diphosphate synthase type I
VVTTSHAGPDSLGDGRSDADGASGALLGEIESYLAAVGRELEPHLQRAIDRVAPVESLKDGVVFQVQSGGKRIRAALCAAACEIFAGGHEDALGYAAAVEHLQNFTLVHDDIADGDEERRGRESAWKRFGLAHGINIGDAFIPLTALAILDSELEAETKTRLVGVLSEHGLEVVEGQSLDIDLRRDDAPTEAAYVACTAKKTGGFFAMAVVGGGIIGGATEEQLADLRSFARGAGVAFQIKDDVLDVVGGKGRAVGSDVLEGKRTVIAAYALEGSSEADGRRLIEILNRPRARTTPSDVAWVHALYRRTGAHRRAEATAERRLSAAIAQLESLPRTAGKYRFLRLCRYLTRRAH